MIFVSGVKGMGYAPDDDTDFDQDIYDNYIDDKIDRSKEII